MNQVNPASDLLDQLWRQKQHPADQPAGVEPDAETRAEISRPAANASAFRGLLFGVPLAIVMWSLPTAAWLATGNTWIGLGAGIAEFVVVGWIVWAKRSPTQPRSTP